MANSTPPSVHDEEKSEGGQYNSGTADPEARPSSPESGEEKAIDKLVAARPSPIAWILTCVGLALGSMLYGLDTTIAADVQAPIFEDLGEIQKLPWVGVGFPMASVAVILLVGKLFGTFEIKWLMISFVLLFEIGSALCGAAPDMDSLIVGRVIAGIGGAGLYIGALSYVSVFTALRERALYNASLGLCWGVGAILGPVIGGAFSDSSASWRWSFYINLPLAAVVAPVYIFIFPKFNPIPAESTLSKFKHIDWIGAFLNAATFVFLMTAITFSGSTWAWDDAGSIALWVLFGVSFISYVVQQTFRLGTDERRALFPVQFVKQRTTLLLFLITSAIASAAGVAIYYVPLFFQFTKGDSALKAAVRLLPFIVVYVVAMMLSGGLLPVFGRYAPWYVVGGILTLVGGVLMFLVDATTSTASVYGFEALIAVGTGFSFQIAYAVVATIVPPEQIADSIGFINVSQIGSIAIALAVAGSIFQNLGYVNLSHAISQYGFTGESLRTALAGVQSDVFSKGGPMVKKLAVNAVVETISRDYALVISSGALTLVCAAFLKWEKLNFNPAASG